VRSCLEKPNFAGIIASRALDVRWVEPNDPLLLCGGERLLVGGKKKSICPHKSLTGPRREPCLEPKRRYQMDRIDTSQRGSVHDLANQTENTTTHFDPSEDRQPTFVELIVSPRCLRFGKIAFAKLVRNDNVPRRK
jgi:hypothetical protein